MIKSLPICAVCFGSYVMVTGLPMYGYLWQKSFDNLSPATSLAYLQRVLPIYPLQHLSPATRPCYLCPISICMYV